MLLKPLHLRAAQLQVSGQLPAWFLPVLWAVAALLILGTAQHVVIDWLTLD